MDALRELAPIFAGGVLGTLHICAYAGLASFVLGCVVATLRISPVPLLQALGAGWVNTLRNCPLTVVLFFAAFGLPELGFGGSYLVFGILGLTAYTSAFMCEAIRSGINSVPNGQAEAARSIGLTFLGSLTTVILPQAIRSAVPPITNALIAMVKNSAIVGAFGVGGELFSVGNDLTGTQGYAALPVLLGVVIGYLIIIFPLGLLIGRVEQRGVFVR